METIKKMKEEISYKFNEEERNKILKRVLENNKYNLNTYWDYGDELTERQIYKIITEDFGLNDIENELYDYNLEYIHNEITQIIEDELNEKEETDEDLKEFLREELESRWDINIKSLLKNSKARFRIDLNTNEDFGYIREMRENKGDYFKCLKQRFKNNFDLKDLEEEINEFMGSEYAKLSFFFEVGGEDILKLRDEYQNGKITIKENVGCGLFNHVFGCGGMLEIEIKKPIKLNLKNWTNKKKEEYNNGYYNAKLNLDSKSYGIQETYGLTGECWKDLY